MVRKKVLIVGGGFAGVKTALELSNDKNFDVTLLTPRSRFEYHGAMYRSATGKSPLEVVLPLSEIFSDSLNIRVELDSVAELRPQTKELEGESGRVYSYDYLIMAVGYVVNYFNIPGMALYSENMYDISAAIKLRHRLVGAFRGAKPNKPIYISVIGAGPTGTEIASDIENFSKVVAGKHGIQHLEVKVRLIEAAPRVLAALSGKTSKMAEKRLVDLDVEVITDGKVTKCTENSITVNNEKIHSDITIWTAGNKANPLFANYPDLFTLDERQRVQVSEYFNANSPDIFVIGDAASTQYSGMAQTAIHNAIALATNLKRVAGNQHQTAYKPKKPEYVVPIGGEWALLETEDSVIGGQEGWDARRQADKWVLQNFLVYDLANKHWHQGEKLADF
jgi:NADH dehydrogenase